jgi:hypothetical protein
MSKVQAAIAKGPLIHRPTTWKQEARKMTQRYSAMAEYQAMATIKKFYWDQKYPSKTPHEIAEAFEGYVKVHGGKA